MERVIGIEITGCHLTKSGNLAGVEGESDATTLEITFDESWDGFSKTILWLDARGENPKSRVLTIEDLVNIEESTRIYKTTIPGEALTVVGEATFSVTGYNQEGKRQRSVTGELTVKEGGEFEVTEDISDPTVVERLQSQIDMIMGDISDMYTKAPPKIVNGTWHIWDAEIGDYKDTGLPAKGDRGDKGDKGDQGEKGDDGYSPQRGTDYWTEEDKAEIIEEVLDALPSAEGVEF